MNYDSVSLYDLHTEVKKHYVFHDGGRAAAGLKGTAGDCVVRAIAIATGRAYTAVYTELVLASKEFARTRRCYVAKKLQKPDACAPRNGVFRVVYDAYLKEQGWEWVPTMKPGQKWRLHVKKDELPEGKIILRLSKHLTACIGGVIYDNHDCSRGGNRMVYGYYKKKQKEN